MRRSAPPTRQALECELISRTLLATRVDGSGREGLGDRGADRLQRALGVAAVGHGHRHIDIPVDRGPYPGTAGLVPPNDALRLVRVGRDVDGLGAELEARRPRYAALHDHRRGAPGQEV